MKPVAFHSQAEAELEEASDYYEGKRAGLGSEFETEVQEAVKRVARTPQAFPLHGTTGLRKCTVPRFPYTVFFMDLEDSVWIAAVAHQRRRPDYWSHRSPD